MACTTPTPEPGIITARENFDAADIRLYRIKHLFDLIANVAAAAGRDTDVDCLQVESICVTFGWLADEIKAAREEFTAAHMVGVNALKKIGGAQ